MKRGRGDDDERSERSVGDDEPEKPQTVRERKRAALYPPIASICSALGGFEEFKNENGEIVTAYALGDQVVGCLKDLKRFWRLDDKDEDRTVARVFQEVGVLKNDLIPILHQTINTSDRGNRIALACVELMTVMTWPIDVAEELRDAKLQDDLKASMDYNSLIEAQQSYKAAILHTGSLRPMFQLLSKALEKSRRERTDKDNNVISLILHMFRNLAAIKDRSSSSTSASVMEMSSLQSEYVVQLAYENVFAFLIAIAHDSNSSEYAPWNMVILDIFHLIFRSVTPKELVTPVHAIDQNRLEDLLETEDRSKRATFKKGNTRHSRFGTTVALKAHGHQYIIHRQSSLAKGAEKSLDGAKKGKAKKFRQDDDLAPPSHLRPEAISVLQRVAVSFIESAFNPFFASVSKDIRMERPKVQPSDNLRFMFLARFFLEFFLLLRALEKEGGIDATSDEGHDFDLVTEMAEPLEIAYVTRRMKSALEDKPPSWKELHAGVECFVQILLLIDAMATSGVEEYTDLAEILQNKLYYEAEQLDLVLTVISQYKNQSYAYLNSIVHLAYVLLRMLEKYSKSKSYMYVRKKKARAKKRKSKHGKEEAGDGLGMGDDDEMEADRDAVSHKEHTFEFETFERKFAQEPVLQTCMTYLESYRSFKSPDQLKRIVALMHRLAVRTKSEALFYKPTVFELFQRIIDDEAYFVSHRTDQSVHDLRKVMEYILRRYFKAMTENRLLLIEAFFPKTRGQLGKMREGADDPYATSEDDAVVKARTQEFEVAEGFTHTQEVGIAIGALVDAGHLAIVEHIRKQLTHASAARKEIVESIDGPAGQAQQAQELESVLDESMQEVDSDGQPVPREAPVESDEALRKAANAIRRGPSDAAQQAFVPIHVAYDSDEHKESIITNGPAKLLMRLLHWYAEAPEAANFLPADHPAATEADIAAAREHEKNKTIWVIPVTETPSMLDADVQMIDDFLADPIDPSNGKTAADLLRKKRRPAIRLKKKRRRIASDDENAAGLPDSDGDGDGDEAGPRKAKRGKGKGGRRKRNVLSESDEDDDDEAGGAAEKATRKRKAKAQKEQVVYKSAQFINDSDDESDAERDARFFAAEAALRDALSTGAVAMTAPAGTRQANPAAKSKGKGKGKGKATATAPVRKVGRKTVVPQARDQSRGDVQMESDLDGAGESSSDDDSLFGAAGQQGAKSGSAKERARETSATSDVLRLASSAAGKDSVMSDDDEDPIGAATQTKKKRAMVVDDSD